jgi:hypothetical protein
MNRPTVRTNRVCSVTPSRPWSTSAALVLAVADLLDVTLTAVDRSLVSRPRAPLGLLYVVCCLGGFPITTVDVIASAVPPGWAPPPRLVEAGGGTAGLFRDQP